MRAKPSSPLKRELLLALWLVGFGLLALPPAVYWVEAVSRWSASTPARTVSGA